MAAEAIQNIFDTTFDFNTTSSDLDNLDILIPDLDESILDNGIDDLLDDIDATEIEFDPNNLDGLDGLDDLNNFDHTDIADYEDNFTNITNVFTGLVNIEDWDTYYAELNIHDVSLLTNLNLETEFELLESFVQEEEWTGLETIETQLEEQLLDDYFLLESVLLTTSPVLVPESTRKTISDSPTDIEVSNEEEEEEEEEEEVLVIEIDEIEDFETIDGIEAFEDLNDIQPFETYEEDEIVDIEEIEEIDIQKDTENIENEVEYQIEDEVELKDKEYEEIDETDKIDKIEELSDRRASNADDFNIDSLQSSFSPHENFQTWLFSELNLFNVVSQGEGYATLEWDIAEVDYLPSFPEIDVFSNPIPSPRFLSVIIDEDFLPDLSFERLDSELLSLNDFDEFTEDFISLNESIDIESAEEFRINPQITLSSLNDVTELVSQAPTIPEPPPYDFQADLVPEENLLDQIVHAQMSDPLYPYSTRKHLKRALKETKHKLNQQEMEKAKLEASTDPKILKFSFIKQINLKKDPKTGHFKNSGDVTVPSNFLKTILPQRFPSAKEGDYFQIKMTNLRTGKSGIDTRQLKSRGRLHFTQNLNNYFEYESGDKMKFEFQIHLPSLMEGKVSNIKSISRFKNPVDSNMMRAYLSKDVLNLSGLDKPNNTSLHWEARGFQGTSKVYADSSIGIVPASLGLQPKPRDFVDQFTIHNTHLTSYQANQITNQARAEFYQRELKSIEDATGIPLTGRPQDDKELMLEYILKELTEQNLFDDFSKIDFHVPIQLPNGKILKRSESNPDGLGYRQNSAQPEIFEIKAFAKDTSTNIQDLENQLHRYEDLGYKVNFVSTSDHIPESIQSIPDIIYTYYDISEMVDKSDQPLLGQMLDKVRQNWP